MMYFFSAEASSFVCFLPSFEFCLFSSTVLFLCCRCFDFRVLSFVLTFYVYLPQSHAEILNIESNYHFRGVEQNQFFFLFFFFFRFYVKNSAKSS